jgi:membrane protein YqaA with SNARE-associated domain
MLPYVLMVFMAMPGPLLWIVNTETFVVVAVKEGHVPALLAACAALGQVGTFLVLYQLGEAALHRVPFFARQLGKWPDERRARLRERTTPALLLGGLTGLPPVVVLACLCSSVAYPRLKMSALVFVTRFARFLVVALGGRQVLGWFTS